MLSARSIALQLLGALGISGPPGSLKNLGGPDVDLIEAKTSKPKACLGARTIPFCLDTLFGATLLGPRSSLTASGARCKHPLRFTPPVMTPSSARKGKGLPTRDQGHLVDGIVVPWCPHGWPTWCLKQHQRIRVAPCRGLCNWHRAGVGAYETGIGFTNSRDWLDLSNTGCDDKLLGV